MHRKLFKSITFLIVIYFLFIFSFPSFASIDKLFLKLQHDKAATQFDKLSALWFLDILFVKK